MKLICLIIVTLLTGCAGSGDWDQAQRDAADYGQRYNAALLAESGASRPTSMQINQAAEQRSRLEMMQLNARLDMYQLQQFNQRNSGY